MIALINHYKYSCSDGWVFGVIYGWAAGQLQWHCYILLCHLGLYMLVIILLLKRFLFLLCLFQICFCLNMSYVRHIGEEVMRNSLNPSLLWYWVWLRLLSLYYEHRGRCLCVKHWNSACARDRLDSQKTFDQFIHFVKINK